MKSAEGPATEERDRYAVPALRRGLAILRLFNHDRPVVAVPEIVRELGVSRATAFRLVHTLETDGYLQRAPHSHAFRLGIAMLSLGFEYLASLDIVEIARPVIEDLRNRTDASAHLGVRDGANAVTVFQTLSRHRLRSPVTVGTRMPAHATSLGRALLMEHTLPQLKALFFGVKMQPYSDQTPTSVSALHQRLEIERAQGYVAMYSGYSPGIVSIAAPIRDASGQIVAGVNVSDHESLPALKHPAAQTCAAVLNAAETIAGGLGYRALQRAR